VAAPLGVLELDAKDALLWRFYTRFVEAVRLCWVEGYTQAEAAQMLGVTQRALRYRLALARNVAADLPKTPVLGV
jgi:DNA-directed RNA polymerase specialized sigma24 family protein